MFTTQRIEYVDGLKGISSLFVVLLHFLLAFAPLGFIGYQYAIAPSAAVNTYWGIQSNWDFSI
ncbi:MAG: hypothetical protein LBN20_03395 [Endomicrobium sp.]|jgi:peptidoglycan/LPS O-acetylase OafA/YrhL|nr:hypothetical protein [Endomicrobium sp.]